MNRAFVHMIYDKLLRVKIKYDNAYLDAFLFINDRKMTFYRDRSLGIDGNAMSHKYQTNSSDKF